MLMGFLSGSVRKNVSSANPLPVSLDAGNGLSEWYERESTLSGDELTAEKAAPGAGKRLLITGFVVHYFMNAANPGRVTATLKDGSDTVLVKGDTYVSVATDGGNIEVQFSAPFQATENTAVSVVVEASEAVELHVTLLGRTVDA